MKIMQVLALLLPFYWLCFCCNAFVVSGLCVDDQKSLLLQFKNNLTFTFMEGRKLNSWNAGDDCCKWMGVTCDKQGHVIGLDLIKEWISSGFDNSNVLFSLQHLQKLDLSYNDFNSLIPSGFNKLKNLTYLSLFHAGFVGQIPIEVSQLTRLVTFRISSSVLSASKLKLENPNLAKFVQNLSSIRQLYLDRVNISVSGYEWCSAVSSLHDLQELSMPYCGLSGPVDSSLARLVNLSIIVLDGNNLSSPVPETFAHFKNLTILSLVDCGLTGTFPPKVFNVGTLSLIDISWNKDLHGIFPDFPLSRSLQTLRVSNTLFSGAIPSTYFEGLHNIEIIDLSYNSFTGAIPNSLSNLTNLTFLDLSFNYFIGQMTSFSKAKNLVTLYLSHNDLSGTITSTHFEGLENLGYIDLSYNSFSGTIPSSLFILPIRDQIWLSHNKFSQLDEVKNESFCRDLDISNNNLSGPFPVFIFKMDSLTSLSLSSNKFSGPLPPKMYSVNVTNADILPLPMIQVLHLASCNLKTFPDFLENSFMLSDLDLSDNQIQGIVPNWIWKLENLEHLNISHNLLIGLELPSQNLTAGLFVIDLHYNKFQGPIPLFLNRVEYMDFSSNKFGSVIPQDIGDYLSHTFYLSLSNNTLHGTIPDSLCKAPLKLLDLFFNNISGTIPSCMMMMMSDHLEILNLKNNNLSGHIPDTVPASCGLWTLNLNGNLLDGAVPKSLVFCLKLEVLDLGSNQITGGFPCFLKEIFTLRIMILRNNKFQGSLDCTRTNNKTWEMLQIVDIAFNNFSGKLPSKDFPTWKGYIMHNKDDHVSEHIVQHKIDLDFYYQDSVTVISKGLEMELVKILTIFTSIDFSSNHFEGSIPEELMDFKELHIMNLSNNAFSGKIPPSIGNLGQLESLDLSQNSLSGEIPMQIASLSFLSYLNLSFNHLVGKIPTGTQLQGFSASSFEGNDGLYGPPLTENLPHGKDHEPEVPPQQECDRVACTTDWNFISVELGLVFGHGIVFGPLLIWKRWRIWYWQLVHNILCWIFPRLYIQYVNQRGQTFATLRWRH